MRQLWGLAVVTALVGAGCTGDDNAPKLVEMTPLQNTDLRGVKSVPIRIEYKDESAVSIKLFADGQLVAEPTPESCDKTCVARATWDTTDFDIGSHELYLVLEDTAGNATEAIHTVFVDDVLRVDHIQVMNTTDDSGGLEIEVFAMSNAGFVGCAGSRHGLANVESSSIEYSPKATLVNNAGKPLATKDFGDSKVRLEVWEDDDDPVCPTVPDPQANDLIGTSPSYTAAEWRGQTTPLIFGNVRMFEAKWTRDLEMPAAQDPGPVDPIDPGGGLDGNSGTSCAVGGSPSGFAVLGVAIGLATLRRRRRR